jgi:hypothetical protein
MHSISDISFPTMKLSKRIPQFQEEFLPPQENDGVRALVG